MTETYHRLPGVREQQSARHRRVSIGHEQMLPGSLAIISGQHSRDVSNTAAPWLLRPGLLIGRISATGLYAASILGALGSAYDGEGTESNVTTAVAEEVERRAGSTGTLRLVGPAEAGGEVNEQTFTMTAIDTEAGTITLSESLEDGAIAGALLTAADGSGDPRSFIPDGSGVRVVDNNRTDIEAPLPVLPVGGVVESERLIPWPEETSLRDWIVRKLTARGAGRFTFTHLL